MFSSKDFPGTIPDHIVVSQKLVAELPEVTSRRSSNAWYDTLDYIEANPDEALKIMADQAELSPAEYEDFDGGTKLFTADEALAAFQPGDTVTSLEYTARLINPFLVESGLTQKEASLTGLFDTAVHQAYVDAQPVAVTTSTDATRADADARPAAHAAGGGRRQHALAAPARATSRSRSRIALGGASGSSRSCRRSGGSLPTCSMQQRVVLVPTPADMVGGLETYWTAATSGPTSGPAACGS